MFEIGIAAWSTPKKIKNITTRTQGDYDLILDLASSWMMNIWLQLKSIIRLPLVY